MHPINMTNDQMAFKLMHLCDDMRRREGGDLSSALNPEFYSCNPREMRLTFAYNVEQWEMNIKNTLHGGITASILDTTMGYLVATLIGFHTSTINMDTYYCRPATLGETLLCEAKIDKLGAHIAFVDGTLWVHGNKNKIIATAKGTYTTG